MKQPLSQPATNEEEEKEKIVEVLDSEDESKDDFEVFNRPESPKISHSQVS